VLARLKGPIARLESLDKLDQGSVSSLCYTRLQVSIARVESLDELDHGLVSSLYHTHLLLSHTDSSASYLSQLQTSIFSSSPLPVVSNLTYPSLTHEER
jgi:hypothetical protein